MNHTPPPLPNIFVATIDTALAPKLMIDLKERGFEINFPPYTCFSAKKKGVNCTLYHSGRLTVQGKEMGPFIEFYLEPLVLKKFLFTHPEIKQKNPGLDLIGRIGIDESGKGDFFGPLCIAGVFAEGATIEKLKKIGVRDSKTLNDSLIIKLAESIRQECIYHIVKINPLKYNELIAQFGNLNHLLAWGHATTIEQLTQKTGCKRIIIDQFAHENVVLTALKRKKLILNVTQRHKGEEDIVVAAASILARCAFVEGIQLLEKQFQIKLPKGASQQTIAAGRQFVRTYGQETLGQIGKMHFKTLDSILG